MKESPFLAGSKYTIADIANYSWVRSAPVALEIDLAEWPALKKWAEGIEKREAVSKGVDVPKRDITPEQMAEKNAGWFSRMPIKSPFPMIWLQFKGPLWLIDVVVWENFARDRRASWEGPWGFCCC